MITEDIDKDGIGDNPLAGVTVVLYDKDGNKVAETVTDSSGNYEFLDVPQGKYKIVEIQPNGYLDVDKTDGDYVNEGDINTIFIDMDAGENDTNNGYIEKIGGSIGDKVWHDENADGLQNNGETGVNGVHICLEDENANPVLDASGVQRCTDTNLTGEYIFEGIVPGKYVVVFTIPHGTTVTPYPQEGLDTAIDSNPIDDIGGIAKAPVEMGLGTHIFDIDMGLVYLSSGTIGDLIWIDTNKNGIQDPGEVGLDGVSVNLYNATTGKLLETIISHDGGKYLFEHLSEGQYIVEFVAPPELGYEFSDANKGSDDSDSDADIYTGKSDIINLKEGEHITVVDSGVFCACENSPIQPNSGDALGTSGMLTMILFTLYLGLQFIRREEESEEIR
jgi:hypothetical protein